MLVPPNSIDRRPNGSVRVHRPGRFSARQTKLLHQVRLKRRPSRICWKQITRVRVPAKTSVGCRETRGLLLEDPTTGRKRRCGGKQLTLEQRPWSKGCIPVCNGHFPRGNCAHHNVVMTWVVRVPVHSQQAILDAVSKCVATIRMAANDN